MDQFYKNLFSKKKQADHFDHEVNQLYKQPAKEKAVDIPHNDFIESGSFYQADTLYLPLDEEGYKYALVVVDIGDGRTTAIPVKSLQTTEYVEAFKKAFKTLGKPTYIQTDLGSEFKKHVQKYFKDENIMVKKTKAGRSRQNSIVEARNKQIGRALFKRQSAEELITGEVERNWIDDLPFILKYINENAKLAYKEKVKRVSASPKAPRLKAETKLVVPVRNNKLYEIDVYDNTNVLPFGQTVRIKLDKPIETANDKKLSGTFRATDIRWSKELYEIHNVIIQDGQPTMYIVRNKISSKTNENKILPVGYTIQQLQVVNKIVKPSDSLLSKKKALRLFEVEKIIGKEKKKGRYYYNVKFKYDPVPQWLPKTQLMKEIPDMIKEFDIKS